MQYEKRTNPNAFHTASDKSRVGDKPGNEASSLFYLSLQVKDRSSEYSKESSVRKKGSYIYEEFMATDGTDVKVYTVGPDYAHAEARKSPVSDCVI